MQASPFRSRFIACVLVGIGLLGHSSALSAAPGPGPEPSVLRAQVIVSGGPTFFATSFEGLGDLVPTRHGDARGNVATLRGQARFVRLFTTDRSLWDWRQQVLDAPGSPVPHDVIVVLLDQAFAEVARWELKGAWPKNLRVSLAPDGLAQEDLELAYRVITRP